MIETVFPAYSWIDDLPLLTIHGEPEGKYGVKITDNKGDVLFAGNLWPDFNATLQIDLEPVIRDLYTPELPSSVVKRLKNYTILNIEDVDYDDTATAKINLFSEDSEIYMSDADELLVPMDYRLPINYADTGDITEAYLVTRSERIDLMNYIKHSSERLGIWSVLLPISRFNLTPGTVFHVILESDENGTISSPVYKVTAQEMEQYLFYNRLGGWDNIPMSGRRTIAPSFEFSHHLSGGNLQQSPGKATIKYQQSSGWLTRTTTAALMKLLESKAIYHLVNGWWRQIVLDNADGSVESDASLQGLNFTYLYSENHKKYIVK